MATNNFKAFATANGANVTAQSDYEALTALLTGFQSGKASSAQINKAIRQSSTIAAVVAQYIANNSGNDVLDNGDTSAILANLLLAVQSSAKTAILPVLTGVIGETRNLRMIISTPTATGNITADEIILGTSVGGSQYRLGNFNQVINLATTGPGGMDVGSINNGYVAIYAIFNPSTGKSALLGFDATNTVAAEAYSGNSMPAGYTASALVSVWRVASGSLVVGYQLDREVSIGRSILMTTSSYSSSLTAPWNPLDISPIVPPNTKWVEIDMAGVTGTNSAFYSSGITGAVDANNLPLYGTTWPSYLGAAQVPASVLITKRQTVYYLFTQTEGKFNSGLIYAKKYKF